VIAEGIEGYQQAEILRKLGCQVGQGFLFAKPMPADRCLEMLSDNTRTPAKTKICSPSSGQTAAEESRAHQGT